MRKSRVAHAFRVAQNPAKYVSLVAGDTIAFVGAAFTAGYILGHVFATGCWFNSVIAI